MLINSYRFGTSYDTDAQAYINAVEAADTAAGVSGGLETATRDAINAFVVGCKADGIWTAIKACCILAGARTLAGALVPLVGTAPTNVGGLFVATDYNRKTGLVGNKSTKYLQVNRLNNADPQNGRHFSCYGSFSVSDGTYDGIYGCDYSSNGWTAFYIDRRPTTDIIQVTSSTNSASAALNSQSGFMGMSRYSNLSVSTRNGGIASVVTSASSTPTAYQLRVFTVGTGATDMTNGRLAFYSIGESLDLALLDTRVTALINAFSTAF